MNRADLRVLHEYNDWANDRLMAMLAEVFGEETDLRQADDDRVRAIQEAAVHIVAAQVIWRHRWEGDSPRSMLAPEEYPTLRAIREAFSEERARFWDSFATHAPDDEAVSRIVHSVNTRGEPRSLALWQILQHLVTHSMYHRGQITGRLIDLGHEDAVTFTDISLFYTLRNAQNASAN